MMQDSREEEGIEYRERSISRPAQEIALVETIIPSSTSTSFDSTRRRHSNVSAPISWAEHLHNLSDTIPTSPHLTSSSNQPRSPFPHHSQNDSDPSDSSDFDSTNPNSPSNNLGQSVRIVIASFILQSLSTGLIYSFGVFQEHLTNPHNDKIFNFEVGKTVSALVGAIAIATNSFASLPVGIACDIFGHRGVAMVSSLVISLSLLLASFSNQMWHLYMTQGILFGFGCSLASLPAMALPVIHFPYGGIASGISSAGSGFGGLFLACFNGFLLSYYGFRTTLRINSVITLVLLSLASVIIPSHPKSSPWQGSTSDSRFNRNLTEIKTKLKDFPKLVYNNTKRMLLFATVGLFHSLAFFIPFYFVPLFSTVELHFNWLKGALIVGIMGVSSGMGQIVFGWLGDIMYRKSAERKTSTVYSIGDRLSAVSLLNKGKHPHPFLTYSLLWSILLAISSLTSALWILICIQPVKTAASISQTRIDFYEDLPFIAMPLFTTLLFIFGILFGFFAGGSMSCSPMVAKEMFGTKHLTTLLGFYQSFRGVGYLLGPPLAGTLLTSHPTLGYRTPFLFGSIALLVASTVALKCWSTVMNRPPTYGPYALGTSRELTPFLEFPPPPTTSPPPPPHCSYPSSDSSPTLNDEHRSD